MSAPPDIVFVCCCEDLAATFHRLTSLVARLTGVTYESYLALESIRRKGVCHNDAVEQYTGQIKSNACSLLETLHRKSLVTKRRNKKDGRLRDYALTDKGLETTHLFKEALQGELRSKFDAMTPNKRFTIMSAAKDLAEGL